MAAGNDEEDLLGKLLSSRDKVVEEFLHLFFDQLDRENKLAGMSADLAQQTR
jgi:hypothetical protein